VNLEQTRTPLTGEMMARGVAGLTVFGAGATFLRGAVLTAIAPGEGGIGPGLAMLLFPLGIGSMIVWGLGGVFVALPIWAGLHALGMRSWPIPVVCGAALVALIWILSTGSPVVAAAGAMAGAGAGWGLWWAAYKRGEAAR